jgi:delta 1-pyrroline-5-carboxylate dehydrogenase
MTYEWPEVGVQPFGGEGLWVPAPRRGPRYLYRFCAGQTVTVNTIAAGGNAAFLAGGGLMPGLLLRRSFKTFWPLAQ